MAKLSPETKIYSNLEPTMIYYEPGENPVDIVIGKDAVYYHPEAAQLGGVMIYSHLGIVE